MTSRGKEVDLTAVIRARDETRTAMNSAKKGSDNLTRSFGDLSKIFGKIGLGSIGVGVALTQSVKAINEAAKSSANLEFRFGLLPETVQDSFNDLRQFFPELAMQYGVTERDVEKALTNIAEATGEVADITKEDLQAALALSRLGFGDVEAASKLYGDALAGNEEAIRSITGNFASFDDAIKSAIEIGPEAVTFFDRLTTGFRDVTESAGELGDTLLKGDIDGLIDKIGKSIGETDFTLTTTEKGDENLKNIAGSAKSVFDRLLSLFGLVSEDVEVPAIEGITLATEDQEAAMKLANEAWEVIQGSFGGTVDLSAVEAIIDEAGEEKKEWVLANLAWAIVKRSFGGSVDMPAADQIIEKAGVTKRSWDEAYDAIIRALSVQSSVPAPSPGAPSSIPVPTPRKTEAPGSPGLLGGLMDFSRDLFGIDENAEGGIATRPTLGVFGEAGAEALIPLNRLESFGGVTVIINGSVDSESRVREVVRETERLLSENARRGVGI